VEDSRAGCWLLLRPAQGRRSSSNRKDQNFRRRLVFLLLHAFVGRPQPKLVFVDGSSGYWDRLVDQKLFRPVVDRQVAHVALWGQ
jgi:hypothetical protein